MERNFAIPIVCFAFSFCFHFIGRLRLSSPVHSSTVDELRFERCHVAGRDQLLGCRVRRPWQQAGEVERATSVPAGLFETAVVIP